MPSGEMRYRPLGRCGTKVGIFGLGGWTTFGESVTDESSIRSILHYAFDSGVNFFDIADVYATGESERAMGSVLRDFPRHELVISSKVFFPMSEAVNDQSLSRKHIFESIHKSLRRIGTDYLDIYFCHRFDRNTPIVETARAMDDLVHQGKVLYWGTSDWNGAQLRELQSVCDRRNLYFPQVEQPRFNLLSRAKLENDVRLVAGEFGMGMVTFSPLAYGILSGKYDAGLPQGTRLARIDWMRGKYYSETVLERVRKMKALADELGCTRAQLTLAWTAAQAGLSSVITGATTLEQCKENLGALAFDIKDEMERKLRTLFPAEDDNQ